MHRRKRLHRIGVLAFAMALASASAWGQTLSRGPLIQNEAGLTSTMTLVWWTSTAGDSTVEYGTTPALGQSVNVAQAATCEVGTAGTCHVVPLTGLQPGTQYYYRLKTNGTVVLATQSFRTFKDPTDTSEMFFDVIGDWGNSSATSGGQWSIATLMNAADPPLLMTVGDNVYTQGLQSEWDSKAFIAPIKSLLQRAVFMPAEGNHDYHNDTNGEQNWATQPAILMFRLPRNAPAGQEERYYSFDSGDVHFVVLDANPPALGSQQDTWLDNDLATTTRKWKFAFLHQMPYTCADGVAAFSSDTNVRAHFAPILEKYQVDVAFTGHNHLYERTTFRDDYLANGNTGSDGLGTTYVVNGGGGASLDSQASADAGGAYSSPGLFGSKTYCPFLATGCLGGATSGALGPYCSVSTTPSNGSFFSYVEVKIQNDTTMTMKAINQNNQVIDTFTITKSSGVAVCGNNVVESGESCDQGPANGTAGSCCTSSCTFVTAGTQCRAAAGVCDVAERCSGSSGACPADALAPATTVCRAAAGSCDVAETCTGAAVDCPANVFAGSSTVCRAAAGDCDVAETCTGTGANCPLDAVRGAGFVCRAAAGVCDVPEACDGSSVNCPADTVAAPTVVCRAAAGVCDVAELCDGIAASCPPDALAGNGTTCRIAGGVCDVAETCDGASPNCPADALAPSTTVCRPSAGGCDPAETCTGASVSCPADLRSTNGTVCRAAAGVCDVAESCDGTGAACPSDAFLPNTTVCRVSAGACDVAETCTGATAACPADAKRTTVCRASASACDAAESCDGVGNDCPPDKASPANTVCRAAAGGCDVAETCDGTSMLCPTDTIAIAGTVCRSATGVCDVAETCSGSSVNCPDDGFAPSSTVCRPSAGVCDPAETCTGGSGACPADVKSAGVCRGAAGVCDVAESCDGVSNDCPADSFKSPATVCRPSAGVCDVAETCTGSGPACPADTFAASTVVCRASAGVCDVAETCTGSSAVCPPDGKSTAVCRPAAGTCDVPETCTGNANLCPPDVVKAGGSECRAVAGVCDVAEHCDGFDPACPVDGFAPAGTGCRAAADVCDVAEACTGASAACPPDAVVDAGIVCRPANGACDVAESCDGASIACPTDSGLPDGDADGVCDVQDDCPADADPGQIDADGDGIGDACDPCTNPAPIGKAKIVLTKIGAPGGDDKLKFAGTMLVPTTPPIDPSIHGVRLMLTDALGGSVLDATIPGGAYVTGAHAGWSRNATGTSWTYKNSGNPTPLIGGIVKVSIRSAVGSPGFLKFSIGGAKGSYPVTSPSGAPITATLIVDPPHATTGECGEARFPGPRPAPSCTFGGGAASLTCR